MFLVPVLKARLVHYGGCTGLTLRFGPRRYGAQAVEQEERPVLRQAGSFVVTSSRANTSTLAGQFARSGKDKFAGVGYQASPLGSSVLDGAPPGSTALHSEYDGGDHTKAVAAVRYLWVRQDAEPLLFFKGRYAGLAPAGRFLEAAS